MLTGQDSSVAVVLEANSMILSMLAACAGQQHAPSSLGAFLQEQALLHLSVCRQARANRECYA